MANAGRGRTTRTTARKGAAPVEERSVDGASTPSTAVTPHRLADAIDIALRDAGRPERAEHERAYLKSALPHYGTSVPVTRNVVKGLLGAHPGVARGDLLAVVEDLWGRGAHEPRMAAVELLTMRGALLGADDLVLVERLLRESRTWALVDGLAVNVVGPLLARFPAIETTLDAWAVDEDVWLRRAVLLAYLLPMRRGEPVFARFAEHADAMLEEREFFIRKALGWVLRERSKRAPDEVYRWLLPRAARASGLTLREAGRYLPPEQREALARLRRPR